MDDRDTERVVVEETPRVERETTVVTSGDGGGGGGAIVAVVLLLVVLVVGFLFFTGQFGSVEDKVDLNVNVEAPNIDVPDTIDVNVPPPSQPSNSQ